MEPCAPRTASDTARTQWYPARARCTSRRIRRSLASTRSPANPSTPRPGIPLPAWQGSGSPSSARAPPPSSSSPPSLEAAHLTVFQRTPPWIHPRPDAGMPPRARAALRAVPGAARALRYAVYWGLESRAAGFAVDPRLMAPLEAMARKHLERQVPDPGLRARLTPDYTIGCKRILLSSDYYPALQRPNVELVTDRITAITPSGVVTADGALHEADVLVFGTGFRVVDAAAELNVAGAMASSSRTRGHRASRPSAGSPSPASRTSSCSWARTPASAIPRSCS